MAYYPETFSVRAIAIILQYTEEFLNHLINTSVFYMDLETNMIGLERCEQIFKIETEKNTENFIYDENTYKNWTEKGNIVFKAKTQGNSVLFSIKRMFFSSFSTVNVSSKGSRRIKSV